MKENTKCFFIFVAFCICAAFPYMEASHSWVGLVIAAAGVATSAYGASQQDKAANANSSAAEQARQDELRRRAAASVELRKAYAAYDAMKEERPGVSFDDYKAEYIKGITDPSFREAFRAVKEEDFNFARKLADAATAANLDSFDVATNRVSGGAYSNLRDTVNEIAATEDTDASVKRALELRSAYIPAGSVRTDSQGRFVEGQRADKQVFTTAFEQDLAARDRQFRMSRDLINDYATLAERQQERAKDFINFGSIEPVARGFATQAIGNAVGFQQQDEANQFALIRDYTNAVFSNQTQTPQYQNPNAYNSLIASGIDAAIKGVSQYASNSSQTKQADTAFGRGYNSTGYL